MSLHKFLAISLGLCLFTGKLLGQKDSLKSVTLHLVNECKICQIEHAPNKTIDVEKIDQLFHQLHNNYLNDHQSSTIQLLLEFKEKLSSTNKKTEYQYLYHFMQGVTFYELELYKEALAEYEHSLANTPNQPFKGFIWVNMAGAYKKLENYDQALSTLAKAEVLFEKHQSANYLKDIYENQANIYILNKRFKEAEKLYQKIIETEIKSEDSLGLILSYSMLANFYYEQYLDNQAIPLFKKSLALAKQVGNKAYLKVPYYNMYIVNKNAGDSKKALENLESYQVLNDSLNNAQKVRDLTNLEKEYLKKQKNATIEILEKDKLLAQQQRNFSILLALAFLAILFLIIYQYRNTLKKNKIIAKQKQKVEALNTIKDELLAVLGHDLRSPIQHLISVFNRGFRLLKKGEEQKLFSLLQHGNLAVNKTAMLLDNILQWVTQQNQNGYFKKEKVKVYPLVQQIIANFTPILTMNDLKIVNEVGEDIMVQADRNSLKIIIRNLIDNAIKFTTKNGSITIATSIATESTSLIQIQDTGVGMSKEKIAELLGKIAPSKDVSGRRSTGLGLRLCRQLLERNDGQFNIKSEVGKGSTFAIELPTENAH